MKGYCGDVNSTRETIDQDGWLHTGDVGYYDEDGYFYIVDRMKELIKYKGFQVPPAELEQILLTHPAVDDAAVLGLPDEESGELPLAFVVKQPGSNVTESEIIEYVNGKRDRETLRFLRLPNSTCCGIKAFDFCSSNIESKMAERRCKIRRIHTENCVRKNTSSAAARHAEIEALTRRWTTIAINVQIGK